MNNPASSPDSFSPEIHETPPQEVRRGKFIWTRFGGDGFLVSMGVHMVLLMIAIFWVVNTFTEEKKEPSTFATGAGGGTGGQRAQVMEQRYKPKNPRNMVKTPSKLIVKGASTGVTLPDMPSLSMNALESGSMLGGSSKGLGGGSGGGIGTGHGVGTGGGRNFVSMFGARFRQPNMLEGTLYDLKRNKGGRHLYNFGNGGARVNEMKSVITGFIRNGMRKNYLDDKYLVAPEKLYTSNVFIPPVNAAEATKAFNCEDIIQAPGWLGYYEGWITPPETDFYRFAGLGDDTMLVVVQSDVKFWGPWTQGGMQTWVKAKKDWEPEIAYRPNGALPNLSGHGRYYGSWFEMRKGQRYKIQILISECYGGLFSAGLLIQQKSKLADNNPPMETPLPVFKLAPLSEDEMRLKAGARLRWTHEGPNFGCEINNVTVPNFGR